jgi:hypothetical protein
MDDEALGYVVDAWLVSLRAQSLSERRLRALAGMLGQAMSAEGPQTPAQAQVLRRFDTWRQTAHAEWQPA